MPITKIKERLQNLPPSPQDCVIPSLHKWWCKLKEESRSEHTPLSKKRTEKSIKIISGDYSNDKLTVWLKPNQKCITAIFDLKRNFWNFSGRRNPVTFSSSAHKVSNGLNNLVYQSGNMPNISVKWQKKEESYKYRVLFEDKYYWVEVIPSKRTNWNIFSKLPLFIPFTHIQLLYCKLNDTNSVRTVTRKS